MAVAVEDRLEFGFADRLRKARRALGLGQQEIADALGVKIASYSNWEAGVSRPRQWDTVITQLVAFYNERDLKVTRGWFLGDNLPGNASFAYGDADLDPTSPTPPVDVMAELNGFQMAGADLSDSKGSLCHA